MTCLPVFLIQVRPKLWRFPNGFARGAYYLIRSFLIVIILTLRAFYSQFCEWNKTLETSHGRKVSKILAQTARINSCPAVKVRATFREFLILELDVVTGLQRDQQICVHLLSQTIL